jgi:hypothetical protein
MCLKSNFGYNTSNVRGLQKWNIVRTLGKTTAKAGTSSFTFSSKAKNYPYAGNAGAT